MKRQKKTITEERREQRKEKYEMVNKIKEGNKFHERYIDGTKYIYVQKHKDWLRFLTEINKQDKQMANDVYMAIKQLDNKENFDDVATYLNSTYVDDADYGMIILAIVKFSKNGPEFYEDACKESCYNPAMSTYAKKIRKENLILKGQVEGKIPVKEESSLCEEDEL